jgi:hypothetical protein
MGVLSDAADLIDPDAGDRKRAAKPELATPVTLAHRLDPIYQVRAHLEVIGDELARIESGDGDRLLLNTPPQVGKSRTAVEWGAFWWLCRHPTVRIIVGSYGDDLALKRGRAIRKLVEHHGAYHGLVLERGSASMKDWTVTAGGGVRSVGVGSGITGNPGDVIFIDDPTKNRAEADSVARRDAIYDWYSADLLSRLSPGAPVIIIQTPWHPDDLRARVVKQEGDEAGGGRWRVIVMAALCEKPEADPLGRAVGEPLPHPKIKDGDTHRLMKHWESQRAAVDVRDWRALWQCDPKAPEGLLVTADMMRERRCYQLPDCRPQRTRTAVAIDPSGGGRDTAGIIAGFLGDDQRLYFTHDRSGVMSSEAWGRAACELAYDVDADVFVIERNFGGDMAALTLRTSWDALRREQPERYGPRFMPRIVEVTARQAKVIRAEPIAQQWKEGRCWTATYLPDLESEWTNYVPGTKDSPGRLDASVHLAFELLPLPSPGVTNNDGLAVLASRDLLGGMFSSRR